MSKRSKWPAIYVIGLLAVASALAFSGVGERTEVERDAWTARPDTLPDLAGIWIGTWEDTIVQVGGDLSWNITVEGSDMSAVGTIDLSALGIGIQQGTAEGTISDSRGRTTLDFTFTASGVGDGSGSIVGSSVSGDGTVAPPLDFGHFTFQATVGDTSIWGTFNFPPTRGAGTTRLTRQSAVEAETWGGVKARYRDESE